MKINFIYLLVISVFLFCFCSHKIAIGVEDPGAGIASPSSSLELKGKIEPFDPNLLLTESIQTGKELFSDPKLGSEGKTCISCHSDTAKSLAGKIQTYPKFSKIAKKVINDVYQINLCLTKPMKGQALSPDDDRMSAILAYLKSL
ncbi:hypothetical protein HYY75_01835 [bacterium]|nr:hypothetical protein [bacterium]